MAGMTIADWVESRTGKYSQFPTAKDPAQSHQCVALFYDFHFNVNTGETYPGGNGADLYWKTWTSYDRIAADQTPVYGDWASWSGTAGAYQNGGAGHIGMWTAPYNATSGYFFTQNPGTASIILLQYSGIQGYLRMNTTPGGAPLTYTLDESYTSPNQTPHDSCPAAFGYARDIIGTTIHHWDKKDSGATWAGTIATLTNDYRNPGSRGVSAHFVVETGRAACLVSPWDAAWHAGNPQGNAQTVGIELNPDESDGTYQTAAEVISDLWINWNIPHDLFPHNHWTSTDCPGGYDLDRLRSMAEAEYKKKTTPQEDTLSAAEVNQIVAEIKASEQRVKDYAAAILVKQWSVGGVVHPGIALVAEENQRRVNTANAALVKANDSLDKLVAAHTPPATPPTA